MFSSVRHARCLGWMTTAAMLLVFAGVARAQETTGAIGGRVSDAQGLAIPGVVISATGSQGTKTATTDNDGRFAIVFLTPGSYTVRAELQGFKAVEQKNVIVRLGQTIEVPLSLTLGGVAETVEVTASSPVIDTTTTTVGATIDAESLSRLPIGRRFSDAVYIAPGVSSGGGTGQANPSIAGGSGLENSYVVDGVNITNSGYGALGSYSIVLGSLGNGVTYDFIKEIQVKTGGYEAEFGQSTGGVVNVVTKSGTNVFRGTVFGYSRPSGTEAGWTQVNTTNGTVNTTATSASDVGVEASGPVMRDKLFFFGAINPQWESRTFVAPKGFPLESLGETDRKRQFTSYAAKGTWQATTNHRLDASFFGDPGSGKAGPQRSSAMRGATADAFSKLDAFGGHNQSVKYSGVFGPKLVVEASWSNADNEVSESPVSDTYAVTDARTVPQGRTGGLGFFENNNFGNKQYQVKATNVLGDHQVRYGVLYEDIEYNNIRDYSGPTFTLSNGTVTQTGATVTIFPEVNGLGQIYRATRANYDNFTRRTTQQYTNFFVQDTWRVGNRLTIKPGIRYEQQKLVGTDTSFKWDGNWAARIGATYDVVGNGRSKVYASWGRFFAKIPNDLASRALSSDAGISRADYFDAALQQPIPEGFLTITQTPGGSPTRATRHLIVAGASPSEIDPKSKSTYEDESVVGFEYDLGHSVNVGVRYIHRNMPRILEDIGTATFVQYDQGAPGLDSVEYFITNPRNNYPAVLDNAASFEDPIHKYDAVEFTVDKRFADGWSVQSSYRWSRLHGTFEGFFRNDNGQSDPAISSLYDFPTNDPTYTAIGVPQFGYRGDVRYLGSLGAGPLPNDRPHQLKVYGNYAFKFGLNTGLGLNVGSGVPLTALAANPNYASAGEIPEGPRGSGFETIDGFKKRSPVQSSVDGHVDYAIRMGGENRIVLGLDAINLFNHKGILDYDNYTETTFGVLNPDLGQPERSGVPQIQTPAQIRFGVRFEF